MRGARRRPLGVGKSLVAGISEHPWLGAVQLLSQMTFIPGLHVLRRNPGTLLPACAE